MSPARAPRPYRTARAARFPLTRYLAVPALALLLAPSVHAAAVDPLLARYARAQTDRAQADALPPLPAGLEEQGGQTWVSVLVRGTAAAAQLEHLGGRVGTVAGDVMTVRVPLPALQALLEVPGLEEVRLAEPVHAQTDVSTVEIRAREAWGGPPPVYSPLGVTGKGVIIGVVDTGIDPTHADFRTATNATRILWLWDQNYGVGAPAPPGFTYGSEYSSSTIGQYTQGDIDGHGTHIAGVAAGNGRATGNGVLPYTYVGVAPEADLVVVRLAKNTNNVVTDDKVIDGVNYVFQKAAAARKAAVVLVAHGKMSGPHDGKDPLDLALTNLTGAGKVIVGAAGNYGGTARHAQWTSTGSNQTGDLTLSVAPYSVGPTAAEHFYSEAWYNAAANYQVSVITPGNETIGPVSRGAETTFNSRSGIVYINNGKYVSSNGSYRVDIKVYRGNTTLPAVGSGTWTFRFKSMVSGTHTVDAWITAYALAAVDPVFVKGMTNTKLVTSPGTADGVVATAAYSTKRNWTDVNGTGRFYPDAVVGDLAPFSSPGPRRDGTAVRAPFLSAPGFGVAAAKSNQTFPSQMWIVPDGVHRMNQGTSVAAAHVAGVAAMLLQTSPSLTPAQLRASLQQRARQDSYTGMVPNDRWGYGKVTAPVALAVDVADGARSFAFAPPAPNPARGEVGFQFTLSGADLAEAQRAGVHLRIVDVRGREVARLQGDAIAGPQRLEWSGRTDGGREAPSGIYFAHLLVGERASVRKFVRID